MSATERAMLLNLSGIDPQGPDGDAALRLIERCLALKQPVPPEITKALVDGAIKFRVIGGTWGRYELRIMHPYDIAILETAGEQFMAGQAINSGAAARGGMEEAEVAAVIDGGAAMERVGRATCSRVLADLTRRTVAAFQRGAA